MRIVREHNVVIDDIEISNSIRKIIKKSGSGEEKVKGVIIPDNINVVWYVIKQEDGQKTLTAQSLRFPTKDWTLKSAKSWLKKNEIEAITIFEALPDDSLLASRTTLPIFITRQFDAALAESVLSTLLWYENALGDNGYFQDQADPIIPDIKMYINSPGGGVLNLLSIVDAMGNIKTDIETYCLGVAASCGAVLLSNGAKGKRFIGKNSHVLLHQVSACACGQILDLENSIAFTKKLNEQILDILAKNTGKDKETIRNDMDRDLWLNADEALAYGLVDKILDEDSNEIKSFEATFGEIELEKKAADAKDFLEKKSFESSFEIKSIIKEDDGIFRFKGYISSFNSPDMKNDIVCPGAFTKTLKNTKLLSNANERSILLNHVSGKH